MSKTDGTISNGQERHSAERKRPGRVGANLDVVQALNGMRHVGSLGEVDPSNASVTLLFEWGAE